MCFFDWKQRKVSRIYFFYKIKLQFFYLLILTEAETRQELSNGLDKNASLVNTI